jgi:hypothetical protein
MFRDEGRSVNFSLVKDREVAKGKGLGRRLTALWASVMLRGFCVESGSRRGNA